MSEEQAVGVEILPETKPRILVVDDRGRGSPMAALLAMVGALPMLEPRHRESVRYMHPDEYARRTGGHVKTPADYERIRAAEAKRARKAAKRRGA